MGTPRIKALTEKQVEEMLSLRQQGKSLKEIAEECELFESEE